MRQVEKDRLCLQQERVVVAFHLALIVITQEILSNGFRLTEIKAISAYRFQPLIRDTHLIDRQILIRQDLEFVAADIGLITVKVEIGVVSQIDRARLIDGRAVLNGDAIIFGQGEARGCGEIVREALVSIEESRENQTSPSFCCTIFQRRLSNPSGPPCS